MVLRLPCAALDSGRAAVLQPCPCPCLTPMARPRPLADFIDSCLGPSLAAQGFAAADILLSWSEIVGERLAAVSQPLRVEWPRRRPFQGEGRPDPASLVVRVEGAFALELQHLAPI